MTSTTIPVTATGCVKRVNTAGFAFIRVDNHGGDLAPEVYVCATARARAGNPGKGQRVTFTIVPEIGKAGKYRATNVAMIN